MNFTAEEIARFDDVLSDMYRKELIHAILVGFGVLFFLVILLVLWRSKKANPRYSVVAAVTEGECPRYRNGKKLSRRERKAQQTSRNARVRQENRAWIAVICVMLVGLGIALGITTAVRLDRIERDMEQDAYAVHEGLFDCDYAESNRTMVLTFTDKDGKPVSVKGDGYDPQIPPRGTYAGRIVYAVGCGQVIEVEYYTEG